MGGTAILRTGARKMWVYLLSGNGITAVLHCQLQQQEGFHRKASQTYAKVRTLRGGELSPTSEHLNEQNLINGLQIFSLALLNSILAHVFIHFTKVESIEKYQQLLKGVFIALNKILYTVALKVLDFIFQFGNFWSPFRTD